MSDRFSRPSSTEGAPAGDTFAHVEAPTKAGAKSEIAGAPPEREFTVEQRTQTQLVIRRFLQHRAAVASLAVFVAVVALAFVGGHFWHYDIKYAGPDVSASPSLKHPFGTDNLGKDEFAQVLRGTQRSVEISLVIAAFAGILGALYGAVAGYYRGITDSVLMRFADLVLTLPLIAVAAVLGHNVGGGSWYLIALVIGGLSWAYVARVVRGVVLSLREKEFIEASRALGASDAQDHPAAPDPQHPRTDHRQPDDPDRGRHPDRDRAVLPRLRRATARHVARPAGEQRADSDPDPTVAVLLPGSVHHRHRPHDQLHRRRPA